MNSLIKIAKRKREGKYITFDDIEDAFNESIAMPVVGELTICLDLLEILGKITEYGAEDAGLCAFIAYDKVTKKIKKGIKNGKA